MYSLTRQKREHLHALEREVNDFHPLLQSLLPKLENVNHVEYTHGPNEKGADFVLERYDATLSETAYVGVIAKLGKIHSDLTDIERQIDECGMDRLIRGGKKKISLNEIWVVTNQNVTENAKDRIHHKYATSKINFIGDEKIGEWIDKYIPYYWHDIPGPLGEYIQKIWNAAHDLDKRLNLMEVDGADLYIPLDIIKVDESIYKEKNNTKRNKNRAINLYEEILRQKIILIEADMGGGKSKLIRHLIENLATPAHVVDKKVIPFLISYKDLVDKHDGSVQAYINACIIQNMKEISFDEYKFIVFVDGLDEVLDKDGADFEPLKKAIHEAQQNAQVKLVMTTRPLQILEEKEPALYKLSTHCRIQPLTIAKIRLFIESICAHVNIPNRIVEDIKNSDLFRQLPQSPIAAILLSKLIAEKTRDLPSNITELYAMSMEQMLGRWDIQKGLANIQEYEAADRGVGILAKYMIDNGLDRIAASEVKDQFNNYLMERNLQINHVELFNKVTARSGVLSLDHKTGSVYFKHRSFAEFMYAKDAYRARNLPIDSRIYSVYWQNLYFFYVGLLKDCPDIINEILTYKVKNEGEQWMRVFSAPSYLLAGFGSPYRLTEENLHLLLLDAADLYLQVRDGSTKTNMKKLSVMHAFWLVQYLVRHAYAYEYFRKALSAAALHLVDMNISDERRAYSLFFLGAICIDLKEHEPFKVLLETLETKEMPFDVSLALDCEMSLSETLGRSPLMKNHERKLKKLLKGNIGLHSTARNLFSNPIAKSDNQASLPGKK